MGKRSALACELRGDYSHEPQSPKGCCDEIPPTKVAVVGHLFNRAQEASTNEKRAAAVDSNDTPVSRRMRIQLAIFRSQRGPCLACACACTCCAEFGVTSPVTGAGPHW